MKKLLSNFIFLGLPLLVVCIAPAKDTIRLGEMDCSYEILNDSIQISLEAPTNGWLAIGFNKKNNIVGSDLLMFCVKEGKVIYEDQFVRDFNQHPSDTKRGGESNIKILSGEETFGRTKINFKIPLQSSDPLDFEHCLNQDFWLILAYSVSDDFDHHSIMRKHIKTQWR